MIKDKMKLWSDRFKPHINFYDALRLTKKKITTKQENEMSDCPDCKKPLKFIEKSQYYPAMGEPCLLEEGYYHCDFCKRDYAPESVEEE